MRLSIAVLVGARLHKSRQFLDMTRENATLEAPCAQLIKDFLTCDVVSFVDGGLHRAINSLRNL